MPVHSHFAESTEEYLEAVYRLEREGPGVTTSGLASELGVAPASVSGMLKKLAADGYLEHVARGDVRLTRQGLEVAVRVVRRHRLAERLLTDVLGMPWDEVQQEACMLEHAISENVEQRLVAILGDPKVCPHGLPIPPKDLSEPERTGVPLAQLEIGRETTVQGVTQELPEMLRYLAEVGLRPGALVRVHAKAPL
ncbi:MAG: metal-dependent transcriptional regulator, partial [Candidatus Baltobacteraceae bacterium]